MMPRCPEEGCTMIYGHPGACNVQEPTNTEQVADIAKVIDAAAHLSERERLAVGLNHGHIAKAKAALASTTAEQVEAVDHRKAAENALDSIGGVRENGSLELAPIAQAHATLALVDEVAKANQDRRERRASAVEELRALLAEAVNGVAPGVDLRAWNDRARKTLAQFEEADHA